MNNKFFHICAELLFYVLCFSQCFYFCFFLNYESIVDMEISSSVWPYITSNNIIRIILINFVILLFFLKYKYAKVASIEGASIALFVKATVRMHTWLLFVFLHFVLCYIICRKHSVLALQYGDCPFYDSDNFFPNTSIIDISILYWLHSFFLFAVLIIFRNVFFANKAKEFEDSKEK